MKMKGFRNPGVNKARYTKGEKPPGQSLNQVDIITIW